MQIKSNVMLKILVPSVLFGGVFIALKSCSQSPETELLAPDYQSLYQEEEEPIIHDLSDDEVKALGVAGDTAKDTIATITVDVRNVKKQLEAVLAQNKALQKENAKLKEDKNQIEKDIDRRIEAKFKENEQNMIAREENLTDMFKDRLGKLTHFGLSTDAQTEAVPQRLSSVNTQVSSEALPIGDGKLKRVTEAVSRPVQDELYWITPDDAIAVENTANNQKLHGFRFPSSFESNGDNIISESRKEYVEKATGKREGKSAKPVYTLPENSTLIGSVAMTALLGRVPIDGVVSDPYPFKVVIGKDNLTANGIELPNVEGAILSGTASGDWTLSCVRGTVHSMTFVFTDGTVRTLPAPSKDNTQNATTNKQIGWISDDRGLPCVPGARKSNAAEYLGSQFLLSAGSAAADAFSSNETTSTVDGGSVMSAVTGNGGKYVLGKALGGGMKETSDWFKQRYGQTFDAVYVPPGHVVAVHITTELQIDYEETGRKVDYTLSEIDADGLD